MRRKQSTNGGISPRLRERLAQVRVAERSGESLKAYAARHGLSPDSLYQAKKEARKRGLLPPHGAGKRAAVPGERPARAQRFVEAVTSPAPSEARSAWRLRFPSGAVLESSAPLAIEEALRLIDRIGGAR